MTLKYVGNHGIWEQINNGGLNAYCDASCITALAGVGFTNTSFLGLPSSAIDPRFLGIQEMSVGLQLQLQRLYGNVDAAILLVPVPTQLHLEPCAGRSFQCGSEHHSVQRPTNISITAPQNPFNVFQNMYGNADYDIRHYFSANYVYTTPKNGLTDFWDARLAIGRSPERSLRIPELRSR